MNFKFGIVKVIVGLIPAIANFLFDMQRTTCFPVRCPMKTLPFAIVHAIVIFSILYVLISLFQKKKP